MSKNVVITGSSRGIGFAMAYEFLKAGCNVTVSGRNPDLAADKHEILKVFRGKYIYVPCNVQDKKSLQELWDLSVAKWGIIDIWINNAGQNAPYKFAWETEESYTYNIIHTNITGMIYGSQIAAAGMLKQRHGAIYSMEGLGSDGMIQAKTILYGTTKRALTYFMDGLAKELEGSGVIAGRLSPGMMLTDFITKDPDGNVSEVITQEHFQRIFNILADRPETVAAFFVPKILANTKNGKQIVWLTKRKAMLRFLTAPFSKRKLL